MSDKTEKKYIILHKICKYIDMRKQLDDAYSNLTLDDTYFREIRQLLLRTCEEGTEDLIRELKQITESDD